MSLLGKIATLLAKRVLIPAIAKIAANPKAPLSPDTAKEALADAVKAEAQRQVLKRLGV